MRTIIFANRTMKEIVRDPLATVFCIGFPIILLLLLSAINRNVPVDLFNIESLTPGIAVFGLSFLALFSAQLIAKDRGSSFLSRKQRTIYLVIRCPYYRLLYFKELYVICLRLFLA